MAKTGFRKITFQNRIGWTPFLGKDGFQRALALRETRKNQKQYDDARNKFIVASPVKHFSSSSNYVASKQGEGAMFNLKIDYYQHYKEIRPWWKINK